MQTSKNFKAAWLFAVLSITAWAAAQAQTTAVWTGPASGGEWNTPASWSTGVVPGLDVNGTTNVLILGGTNVSYTFPMTAASIGILTNNGILNVNTNGFNATQIVMTCPAGNNANKQLNATNAGTVINVSGNFGFLSNSVVTLSGGATLTVQGSLLIGSGIGGGSSSGNSGSIGFMTNSGGFLSASATSVNPANAAETSLFVISGGTNNLGNTKVERCSSTTSYLTLGTEGLIIYGGLVITTNLNVGGSAGNSTLTTLIAGGVVTNFGTGAYVNGGTAGRPSRLLQTGGLFVVPDPEVVNLNTTAAGANSAAYSVTGGTNIVGGFYFGASNSTVASTVSFTNGAAIYVGSLGIASNGAAAFNNALKAGGLFGATAPWTGSAAMNLLGTGAFTFQTADQNGNPNNITDNAVLSGSVTCALNVTGGGTLTLGATNTYAGTTLINGGKLALGANSALASSLIIVGLGTTFDVSAVSSGFVLNNLQTLSGSGTVNGAVALASGATITSGSNALTGTLTLNNSLTETNGGAVNHFVLSGAPNPNNDLIVVVGDLNVGATNSVDIAGTSLVPGTNYIVFRYGGNFNGGISNFVVTTAFGTLSNDPVGKTISFIPAVSQRGTTNTVWIGNPVNTNWDNELSTNWLISSSSALTTFVPGDSVQFTDLGATNSPVNIVGTVSPTTILVNSHSNYVIASTSGGWIAGTTGLTVTNTGTLTILTTNTYTGATIIDGGSALAVSQLALNGFPGAVGESDSLVINNGTFVYSGPSVSIDRGATLGNASSAINISANGNLTLGGNLTGTGGLTMVGPGTLIMNGTSSYAGVTTLSNGTLEVNGSAALNTTNVNFDGGTLSFESQSAQNFYANIFDVVTTGTMIFNGANGNNIIGTSGGDGGFSGSGTLNIDVVSNGICTINAHMEGFTGTIHLTDASLGTLRFNSGGGNNAAQICTGSTNVTFDLGNGAPVLINRNGGGSSGGTNYNVYDLGGLAGGPYTKVSGGTTASIYSIGANNSNTVFAGTIQNTSSSSTVGIIKVGTGTLTLLGESTYTGPTIVSNGVLALSYNPTNSNDGEIFGSSNITIMAGAVIDVSGEQTDPGAWQLAYSSSQTLQGSGMVNGILDASSSSSTISPGGGVAGGSIGTLTVTHTIFLGGTEWMKINRAASPNSDQLVSSLAGGIDYFGGTLVVTNIGPRLHVGDTFTLFSSGSGSLDTIILPGYYTWDTSHLIANGTVTVTAVLPLPSVTKADFSGLAGGAITLNTTNGIPGTTVNVLTSTNLASPFNSWKTVTNTTFNANGNLTDPNSGNPGLTIYVNPTNSPSFYLLQTLGH